MMPWNPIHRYAGVPSSIDAIVVPPVVVDAATDAPMSIPQRYDALMNGVPSDPFGNAPVRDVDVSFGHATGLGSGAGADSGRRPLGFVDVRSEAGDDTPHERLPDARDEVVGEIQLPDGPPAEQAEEQSEEKIPFFKREINFGRKKAAEPTIELEPQSDESEPEGSGADELETEPVAAAVAVDADPAEADEKVPFFKRELSLRKKREDAAAPVIIDAVAATTSDIEPDTPVGAEREEMAHEEFESPVLSIDEPALSIDEPAAAEVEITSEAPVQIEAGSEPNEAFEPEQDSDIAGGLEWPEQVEPVAEVASPEPVTGPESEAEPVGEPLEAPVAAAVAKAPFHKREFGKSRGTKSSSTGRGNQRRGGRVVGLKIGASQLAAAVVEAHDGRPELVELARSPLEAGIVVDGEIRDPEALTKALRTFFADNKLPTKDIRIGIASNRIGVRTFEISGVEDDSRFDNAVRFKAHEVLPIAGSESVLDYRVLDERQSATGETTRRILLVVAPRDQVAPYAEAAQRAGLKLAGIDLESLGLLRAFVEPQNPSDRKATDTATVVVAIGHEASTLMVSGGGVCEFTRVFDWGGSTMQDAIAQELDVRPAEAATILRHLSLAGTSSRVEGFDEEARNRAVEAVRLRLTPFARELVSSLQFYQTQPDSLGIGEIVITGGASQLDGLADALHQMIGVAVRVGDPLQRVAALKGVETGFESVIGSLSVAIGLGIDDGAIRSVNLVPGDLAKVTRRKPSLVPVLLPIAAVVPLAAVGFLFFQAHGKVSDRSSQLGSLNTQFAALPQPKRPQIDAALQGLQAQRASAVAQVLGARTPWDTMLADFARVLPSDVWLTALAAKTSRPLSVSSVVAAGATAPPPTSAGIAATPAAPTGVTITGYTYAQPDVATLLARLSALPSLQNVQLQSSQVATIGKRDIVQFTILADLRETGGTS